MAKFVKWIRALAQYRTSQVARWREVRLLGKRSPPFIHFLEAHGFRVACTIYGRVLENSM